MVAQVTCGAQHTLARTHEGSVFSWGEGEHGQLGQQDTEDYYAPVRVEGALTSKRITMVACGSQHSLAVTSAGELFAWGRGDAGQLGMGRLKDEDRPSAVTSLAGRFVTACAAGENHSACLADNGSLLTWGAGDMGKLGHGRGSRSQLLPRVVQDELAQHRVTQVSLGMAHTACVTSRGQVFAWGGGWFGRLGVGNTDNQYTPQRVTALQYRVISRLSCGSYHTIFCTEDGEVYVCGRGDSRLGLPGASDTLEPTLVVDLKHKQVNVIDVAAGEEHSLAMAANGGVWAWGKGRYGKLGVGSDDDCERPEQVAVEEEGGEGKDASLQPLSLGLYDSFQRLKGVKDIRGISTYSNHSVALDSYGQVFVFGCGGSGRLGLNNTDNATLATLLSNPLLPPAEDFDKLGTEGKEEGEEGGKGQGKGGDEKDAGDDLVDLGFDEEDEDKEEEGNQAMGGQEGSALAQTQALLQVFRTKDMEAGPPVGRVQQLLGSEPRGHRVDKIQESIESLLDVRAEALRLMRSCKSLEDEVKAIEHKIEVTVSSTVKRAIPSKAGAPITLKVPFDVQDNLVLFERVFSMFLANPMYLTNIFRHYLSTPDRRDATLAEGLEGEELFVELCFAVYGPMTQGRSERLFLVLVEQILQEEVRLAAAHTLSKFVLEFARADSVFGLFVTEYFRREENVVTLRNMFSEPLHEFLTETESGKAMDLNFDPVAVHNALEEDPTKHVDDLSATETLRRELYARGDIKAEVNARVARLMHVAQDWFDRIARAMTGLPFGVRWVCGKVLRYVTERFQVGDEDEANFQFMVGKFVLDRYIRPAIQFPKRFGLLGRNARLTTVQNVNLKLLADVLRHMAANSEYQAEQVWLKPLNSVIKQYSGAAQTMVRQLVDVEPDFSHDLLVDSFYEHLRLSPLVHKVQLNQLLYLRAILARDLSEVVVKPADPLEHMASKLFPSEVHREKARELVTRPREQDYGINLVIDTRFNEFPDGEPLLCPHSGVPLPEFLAPPDSQRMVLEEMFRVDESSRGGVALREILRGAKQLGASADLDGLKRYLSRMAKQGMEDGDLAMSLQARYAEDAIQDVELRSRNPSAALMIQLLQGIEDRAKKAERLDQEQSTFEALKTSIYNFRQQLVAKRAALTKYLTILRQGVKTQQNRRVVDGTALRSKEKLTPDNLVRATHKTGASPPFPPWPQCLRAAHRRPQPTCAGATEKTKLALDDEAQVLGAFAVFTYRQLSRRDVVLSLKFKKQTQKAIDPKKLCVAQCRASLPCFPVHHHAPRARQPVLQVQEDFVPVRGPGGRDVRRHDAVQQGHGAGRLPPPHRRADQDGAQHAARAGAREPARRAVQGQAPRALPARDAYQGADRQAPCARVGRPCIPRRARTRVSLCAHVATSPSANWAGVLGWPMPREFRKPCCTVSDSVAEMQGHSVWPLALACLLLAAAGAVADDTGGTLSVRSRGTAMGASLDGLSLAAARTVPQSGQSDIFRAFGRSKCAVRGLTRRTTQTRSISNTTDQLLRETEELLSSQQFEEEQEAQSGSGSGSGSGGGGGGGGGPDGSAAPPPADPAPAPSQSSQPQELPPLDSSNPVFAGMNGEGFKMPDPITGEGSTAGSPMAQSASPGAEGGQGGQGDLGMSSPPQGGGMPPQGGAPSQFQQGFKKLGSFPELEDFMGSNARFRGSGGQLQQSQQAQQPQQQQQFQQGQQFQMPPQFQQQLQQPGAGAPGQPQQQPGAPPEGMGMGMPGDMRGMRGMPPGMPPGMRGPGYGSRFATVRPRQWLPMAPEW